MIPKNTSNASFIFHLVALNNKTCGKPPSFTLPTIEALARLLQERKLEAMNELDKNSSLWATHVDLGNCFWSLELPKAFWASFGLKMGDKIVSLIQVPFGWKCSLVLCQRVWQHFKLNLGKDTTLILHYLDDFCIIGLDRAEVRRVRGVEDGGWDVN